MSTFIIDTENSITALTAEEAAAGAPDGTAPFTSEKELLRLATDWPAERLVEVWNGIPGVKAITRFTSRKAGAAQIWKANPEPGTDDRGNRGPGSAGNAGPQTEGSEEARPGAEGHQIRTGAHDLLLFKPEAPEPSWSDGRECLTRN